MILTTTNEIQGREVSEYVGLVHGDAIVGAHVIKDFFAGLRDFFGGRSRSYEKTLQEAREEALKDLVEQATVVGADAVVALDFEYQTMGQTNSMLAATATGTAVKLR